MSPAPLRRIPRRVRAGAALGAVLAMVSWSTPTRAQDPVSVGGGPRPVAGGASLGPSPDSPVLTFSAPVVNRTPFPIVSDPLPQVCVRAAHCDLWALHVATKDPFLVSIRNAAPGYDANDGFNLYVYDPRGRLVGSSAGIGSDGQAVAVGGDPGRGTPGPNPGAGVYTLAVTVTYAYDNPLTYLGEARVLEPPSWSTPACSGPTPCTLLPQLAAMPPSDFHLSGLPPAPSTPLGFPLPVSAPTRTSCYADETAQTRAKRCLRFTTDVRNIGAGVLQLGWDWADASASGVRSGLLPGECEATQVVYRTDGSSFTHDAGPCEFHAAHGHFHYRDLVIFALHRVASDGTTNPKVVSHSVKESFCLADDDFFGFGTAGPASGPRDDAGVPGCDMPSRYDTSPAAPTADGVMGISPGWGDVYTWDTPDQYLDVTGLADGVYDVVEQVNPDQRLDVASPTTPCASTRVHIAGSTVTVVGTDLATVCP